MLVFVNDVNEGVRLRLFLEAFGIRPALLNAELPLNSRRWDTGWREHAGVGICVCVLTYMCV